MSWVIELVRSINLNPQLDSLKFYRWDNLEQCTNNQCHYTLLEDFQ
jgi:hypothetical protein